MTNLEYYKEALITFMKVKGVCTWFIDKSGKICELGEYGCSKCIFDNNKFCMRNKIEWLLAEHEEKPKLTVVERNFLKTLKNELKYITRDENGELYCHNILPQKKENEWSAPFSLFGEEKKYLSLSYFKDVNFPMIKWEDEKPWRIEDLLKLEVIE